MTHYVKKNLDDIEIYDTVQRLPDQEVIYTDLEAVFVLSNEIINHSIFSVWDRTGKSNEVKKMCKDIIEKSNKRPAIQVVGESSLSHCLPNVYDLGCRDVFITDNSADFLFKFGKICQFFKDNYGKYIDKMSQEDIDEMRKKYYEICMEGRSYANRTIDISILDKDHESKSSLFLYEYAFWNQYRFNRVCEAFSKMRIHLCLVDLFKESSCINFSQLVKDKDCELFYANQTNVHDYHKYYIESLVVKSSTTSSEIPLINELGKPINYNIRHFPLSEHGSIIKIYTTKLGYQTESFYYTLNDFMDHFPRDIKYYIDNCDNFVDNAIKHYIDNNMCTDYIKNIVKTKWVNYSKIYTQIIGLKMIPTSEDIIQIRKIIEDKVKDVSERSSVFYLCDLFDSIIAQTTDEERAREELKDLVPIYLKRISEKSIEEDAILTNGDITPVSEANSVVEQMEIDSIEQEAKLNAENTMDTAEVKNTEQINIS